MRSSTTHSARMGSALAPPWGMQGQNLLRPQRETETTRQMSCEVVFGSPSANCMGTGVCRISARGGQQAPIAAQKRRCRHTSALMFPIEGGKGVSMVLTRSLLCSNLYKTHLRHGKLVLDSPCRLPQSMVASFGLTFNELSVGDYAVHEAGDFIRIDFK
ncbi:MAG: hypothetical protein SFV22_17590 [Saprospiraceae bacterium]|nr:hypothetical protein [Saprospiraceae bacterium]